MFLSLVVIFSLAMMNGLAVESINSPSRTITERLDAAQQGDAVAQFAVGLYYEHGVGVERNPAEAVKWYRKAADQGNADAQFAVGLYYEHGVGVERNPAESVKWYRKAADQGNADAQFALGVCYAHGVGVERNPAEAAKWYRKAADQGDASAQHNLGFCYENGAGVKKNLAEAAKWYRKAAEQGLDVAQRTLAIFYKTGKGVEENLSEAAKWYRKAAEQGDAVAQRSLGFCYKNGNGVEKNLAEAVKWYRMAAEQGEATAQWNLANAYWNGTGCLQDDVEAMKWRLLAVGNGGEPKGVDGGAVVRGERDEMRPADYQEAQRRAREWQEKREQTENKASGDSATKAAPPASELTGSGTAFCISSNGYFLTCAHVVDGAEAVSIVVAGKEYAATVVKRDSINDIAVLKVSGSGFHPLPIVLDEPDLGAKVFTIGFPNPDLQGQAPKYTDGAVSSLSGIQDDPRTYQITVPVQSGNSGGPLVNADGNCVGIVVAKMNAIVTFAYTGDIPQNVNFAMKMAYALPLVNSIPEIRGQLPAPRTGARGSAAETEKTVGMVLVRGGTVAP